MNRRQAFGMMAAGAAAGAVAMAPKGLPAEPDLRVRIVSQGLVGLHYSAVYDCATGENISGLFPITIAHRLQRSYDTHRPVRVMLYRRNSKGCVYMEGDKVAREMKSVLVVDIS